MESMTGYAYIEKNNHQFSFSVEIKSLNSKFLEVYVNLPKILRKEENDFIIKLKEKFSRGKVVLTIDIFDWIEEKAVLINKDRIRKIYSELKDIENELNVENFFSGDTLFSLENTMKTRKSELSKRSYNDILNVLNKAVENTKRMQRTEGANIKKDIIISLEIISEKTVLIKKKYRDISKLLFNKLRKNIEAISGVQVSDVRLYSEIAILADKIDINEELVRLNDHVKKFKAIMSGKGQIGKSLDFLAQEMFRESNTISSKANSSEISHIVVEIKNNIDKIREHARNII